MAGVRARAAHRRPAEGRGAEATVLVFHVKSGELIDRFQGEVVSSRQENNRRAIEELPGLHAVAPSGDRLAYRTVSGALAVRRNTVRSPTRRSASSPCRRGCW